MSDAADGRGIPVRPVGCIEEPSSRCSDFSPGRPFKNGSLYTRGWKGFEITYRMGETTYLISVENPSSVSRGMLNSDLTAR